MKKKDILDEIDFFYTLVLISSQLRFDLPSIHFLLTLAERYLAPGCFLFE